MQGILKFNPIYKDKIWGGRKLETNLGRKIPDGNIGESWEISDYQNEISIISNGEFQGKSFREIYKKYPKQILGEIFAEDENFPLLVKIIDAKEKLSVQVHPDDNYANEKDPDSSGKKEAWYILNSDEKAEIVCGFKEELTQSKYKNLIEENKAELPLQTFTSKAGDSFIINPGTVHAIGGGNLLLEVQQSSDSTYRVYDYGRLGDDGKPRKLHLEKALDVLNFNKSRGEEFIIPQKIEKNSYSRFLHVSNDKFRLESFGFSKEMILPKISKFNVFNIIHILEGNIRIEDTSFQKGETFILTAEYLQNECKITSLEGNVSFALMTVGSDWLKDLE